MPRRLDYRAFTLIEVLVVVAIIALLVAVLIPSLAAAREQARIAKCLSTQSNYPKAVQTIAADHKGYGPLISAPSDEPPVIDASRTKYDYEMGMFGNAGPLLKPWPMAMARALGDTGLKKTAQYFDTDTHGFDVTYFQSKFSRRDIFTCPNDTVLITDVWSPFTMYGMVSYAPNEDILGQTRPANLSGGGEGQCWRLLKDHPNDEGWAANNNPNPAQAPRLEGRIDRIERPAEVVLFCEGGREYTTSSIPALFISSYVAHGPYIENAEYSLKRFPHFRHSNKGGLTSAFADGSAKFLKPLRFTRDGYVERYGPNARISPYSVGPNIRTRYPQP